MALDTEALRMLLRQRLCEDVRVQERPDGALMLRTNFHFPDGDRYPIHLCESPAGGLRLSDRGHTLMHISYEHDLDTFLEGTRGMVLERIINEAGLCWDKDGGGLRLDTVPERLPEDLFTFGQALTRVYDLTLLSPSNVRSIFYQDSNNPPLSMVDKSAGGGPWLSDRGHTPMHISHEYNIMALKRIINEVAGLRRDEDGGALFLDTVPERLPEDLFTFGQAPTRIHSLTLPP